MRRILLLLCVAFVVVGYAIPCFILPFGEYRQTEEVTAGVIVETTLKLNINGKATYKGVLVEGEFYYSLKDGDLILYSDKDKATEIISFELKAFNKLGDLTNQIGNYIAIAFGIIAVVGILLPYKKS